MKLLKDSDIVSLLVGDAPILTNVIPPKAILGKGNAVPEDEPWYGSDSCVQPSSLDLHVGQVFIPEVEDGKRGSVKKPIQSHSLPFGHTAVVVTREKLNLPKNICGFGFPPSHVAFRGLLLINPGHVDPGFEGQLRLTVINVGKEPISLESGELIFTLLLVQLDAEVRCGYKERRSKSLVLSDISREEKFQSQLDYLSRDFLDVESRTKKAADESVKAAGIRGPIYAAIFGGVLALFTSIAQNWKPIEKLEDRVSTLESMVVVGPSKSKLDQIEELKKENALILERIAKIETGSKEGTPQ